ncbi:MAG: hypothetical protein WHV28_04180 [Bacteroidota bacterium]
MNNFLVIAYYFPPSGGPGVQRVLKHIKYIREFGWQPIVLTVENGQFPARDESLFAEIPDDVIVRRTKIYEPYDIYRFFTGKKPGTPIDVNTIKKDNQELNLKERIAEFIRATFFIPDARVGWLFTAKNEAIRIIREHNCKAIYSSSPPYTCSLIARYAKRKTKLPWVAGFRDPWTGFISAPKRWFLPAKIDRYLEKSVFEESNYVECAWEGIIKDALSKYHSLIKDKFIHVPNGFDSDDFPNVEYKRNDKFTLTYTGSMYGRRNPYSLLIAIENLLSQNKISVNDFRLKFIGRFGNEVLDMFNNCSFRQNIEIIGYIPHKESIAHLMASDALLLVVDESKESEEIVPGKVYEYIGVHRPILAIAPINGAIARLIYETNSGKVAHQTEINTISDIFLEYINLWKSNSAIIRPNLEVIQQFERKNAAKKLAELLNSVAILT